MSPCHVAGGRLLLGGTIPLLPRSENSEFTDLPHLGDALVAGKAYNGWLPDNELRWCFGKCDVARSHCVVTGQVRELFGCMNHVGYS